MKHAHRWLLVLLGAVAVLGFAGCDDLEDDPPDNISGVWSCTFSRAGETSLQETWIFQQDGETVWGSYTFKGDSYSFAGSYDDGEFRATDSDNWTLRLDFDEEDEGDGTISGFSASSGANEVWDADLSR